MIVVGELPEWYIGLIEIKIISNGPVEQLVVKEICLTIVVHICLICSAWSVKDVVFVNTNKTLTSNRAKPAASKSVIGSTLSSSRAPRTAFTIHQGILKYMLRYPKQVCVNIHPIGQQVFCS